MKRSSRGATGAAPAGWAMAVGAARIAGPWAERAAAGVMVLNLFDALFTLSFLQAGLCTEANPFMRGLYLCSPLLFMAVKLLSVNVGLAVLVRLKARPLARAALAFCVVAYVALAAYELTELVQQLHRLRS
ncbi:MAG: hypothetical protein JST54_16410 [Deltaproteobacteria bacterium]|nr:hypothetical protein [Deltaproteobacteria bacterium]